LADRISIVHPQALAQLTQTKLTPARDAGNELHRAACCTHLGRAGQQ